MIVHGMRRAWRSVVSGAFMLFMMCVVGFIYHRFHNNPPGDNMKIFLQWCGGALAIFIALLVNALRVRRNEAKAKKLEGS